MVDNLTPYEALMLAITRAGSQAELARRCGISPTAVWKWVQSSKRVGHGYALAVEEATGVSRHALRPDLYPREHVRTPRFIGIDLAAGVDRTITRVSFNRDEILKRAQA